jgi:protein-L-isoaspartate(D-aspartate) O-methyltransferase
MDFERARFNMIEQQIRPWDVLDQEILELLRRVPREDFVPQEHRALSFSDLEIPISVGGKTTGQSMLSPKLEARMLQELGVRKHENVLEIGAGTGYMAALLSHRAREVLSLEINADIAALASRQLAASGVVNAKVQTTNAAVFSDGQFDAIMVSGSVAFVPPNLLDMLKPGGRLIAVVGMAPSLTAQLVSRDAEKRFTTRVLFDTYAPTLIGFPSVDRFTF